MPSGRVDRVVWLVESLGLKTLSWASASFVTRKSSDALPPQRACRNLKPTRTLVSHLIGAC